MTRVKWKGPYIQKKILKKGKKAIIASKNFVILPKFVGLNYQVYNGKTFVLVKILTEMVGHKLGEFVPTRKQFTYKKKKR